jgi:hypothetical protein
MDLSLLFQQYYFQYRVEAVTPPVTDDEFTIFVGLANEAINRWSNYDNTYWKELFDTAQIDGTADLVIAANTIQYAAPSNMREAGGFIKIYDSSTGATLRRIPIIEPQEAQFKADLSLYCYFTGDPNNGFTLNINPEPDNVIVGQPFDYIYYKQPTLLSSPSDTTEMSEPYFIIHRALANRFRGSRNPYYQSAKNDAEDVLKTMQMDNNSGSWANPWKLADNSGSQWGTDQGTLGLML